MALKKLEWWDRYKVSDDSTDIRGWKLLDRTGHCMGEITDLIFEEGSCRVRYAVADVAIRKVLVPVGLLALDEKHRQAVAHDLSMEDIDRLSGYTGESDLDAEAERRHYQDYQPTASRLNYAGNPYTHESSRIERIEERLRAHIGAPEATFAGTEPDPDNRNEPGEPGSVWR